MYCAAGYGARNELARNLERRRGGDRGPPTRRVAQWAQHRQRCRRHARPKVAVLPGYYSAAHCDARTLARPVTVAVRPRRRRRVRTNHNRLRDVSPASNRSGHVLEDRILLGAVSRLCNEPALGRAERKHVRSAADGRHRVHLDLPRARHAHVPSLADAQARRPPRTRVARRPRGAARAGAGLLLARCALHSG